MWLSSLNPEFTATTHINFKEIPHFSTKPRLTVLLIEALWERDLQWVSGISPLSFPINFSSPLSLTTRYCHLLILEF
jgi:hypothetical protein